MEKEASNKANQSPLELPSHRTIVDTLLIQSSKPWPKTVVLIYSWMRATLSKSTEANKQTQTMEVKFTFGCFA